VWFRLFLVSVVIDHLDMAINRLIPVSGFSRPLHQTPLTI
jgi:hypothetical protein